MPRNGSGSYSLPAGNPVISSTVIRSTWANTTMSDIATALTGSLAKDGQTAPTANLPMAGFRHTNVAIASASSDYARASQVQNGSLLFVTVTATGGGIAYEGTLPFGGTAFATGQHVTLVFGVTNASAVPTLSINGSTAWTIQSEDGTPLAVGDILEDSPQELIWNGANWLLQGATGAAGVGVDSFNTRTGTVSLLLIDVTDALGYTPVNKAGDTMTGTLNGLDSSFKRYLYTSVVQAPSATLDFSVNQTVTWTLTGDQTLTSITGLATEGNEGVLIVKETQTGGIDWPSTVKWPNGVIPNLAAGSEKQAIVTFRRVGTNYLSRADTF